MSFELDTAGADEIDAQARAARVPFGQPPPDPGFMTGAWSATFKGAARGMVAKPAMLLGDAMTPVLRPGAQAVDKALGTSLDAWLLEQQRRNASVLDDLRPDPLTTGMGGQILGSFADIGTSTAFFGPAPAAVFEGYGRRHELVKAGVDPNTATAVGAVSGVATYAGVKAPLTLGAAVAGQGQRAIAQGVAYGAGISVGAGVAERGTSQDILARNGYDVQAALVQPFDLRAMAAEAVLGGLFSGSATALQLRFSERGAQAVDAALAVKSAKHAALDTAPGVPADTASMAAHQRAFETAMEQTLRNEPVNVGPALDGATFVREPSETRQASRQALQAVVMDNESRGRRYGKDGQLLTSPKGAQGEMQVMPATARDPGYGVMPARDNSPEELARVGRDFLDAMRAKYGDDAKAMAAYNAGPGRLDAAIQRHGDNWLAHMPAETKAYVARGMTKLGTEPIATPVRDARPDVVARRLDEPPPERRVFDQRVEPTFARADTSTRAEATAVAPETVVKMAPADLPYFLREPGQVSDRATFVPALEAADPVVRAGIDAAVRMPEMRVAFEDGTTLSAREVFERAEGEAVAVRREATGFEAAVNCFLRSAA